MSSQPEGPASKSTMITLFVVYMTGLVLFCVFQRRVLFAWPAGIVTGNLLASAIWAPLAVVHLDRLARRHHREHMAVLHRHHRELLQKVAPDDQ